MTNLPFGGLDPLAHLSFAHGPAPDPVLIVTATRSQQPGYIHIKQADRDTTHLTSALIDRLSPEYMRRVIKAILGCKSLEQPHGDVGTNGAATDGQLPVANPAEIEGAHLAAGGQPGPERSGDGTASVRRVDLPEGDQLFATGQAQVGAVRPLGVHHLATLKVHILLDVEPRVTGE